jgi:hypothetical protein
MSNTQINTAALTAAIAEAVTAAVVGALGEALATPEPAKAAPKGKRTAAKGKTAVTGVSFKERQVALKALKAEGKAPAGMTVKEAMAAGLLGDAPKASTKASIKGKGKKAAKPEGTPFPELRARLVALKAEGLVPAGMSVREAQAEGLVDDEVRFIGTAPAKAQAKAPKAKATKPAKGKKAEKVVAEVEADAPAKARPADMPRRANGTITPHDEWETREALAMATEFSREQIDVLVARGLRVTQVTA